jgi:ribosomal protein S18 acetylase RimI-like enzyme
MVAAHEARSSEEPASGPSDDDTLARGRRIEEASLRAWPAHSESDFDGWRLRFADGYTRRANSVTAFGPSRLALDDKVATCERLYSERGLPAIFRMTPFAPPELDAVLEHRGYRRTDETEVRARRLDLALPPPGCQARVRVHGVDSWLEIFGALSGSPARNRPAHRAVLNAVPGTRRLLVLWFEGTPAACGMSVHADGLLGLFDLVTATERRNRGFGSEILRRALLWGARQRTEQAYLQVLTANTAARRIYERLNFELVYRYHYRERS